MAIPSANSNRALRPLVALGGLVLVTAFLYFARPILMPLALAVLLAFVLTPLVLFLEKRRVPRVAASILVVLFALSTVGGIAYAIGAQFAGLLQQRQKYMEQVAVKVNGLTGGEGGFFGTIRDSIRDWNQTRIRVEQEEAAKPEAVSRREKQEPSRADGKGDSEADKGGEAAGGGADSGPRGSSPEKPLYTQPATSGWTGWAEIAGPAAEGLATTFLVVVSLVFMLIQRENLRNRVVRLLGHGRLVTATEAIDEGASRVSKFLVMQLTVNVGFGLVLMVGLLVLSLFARDETSRYTLRSFALLWGFVAATLRFIPYLGTWVAAVLLFAFSVATLQGWVLPLLTLGLFIVMELLTANVLEPLLFGHSTGVTPLALLLAAAFWTWLWGPVGLLLSTPLTVVLLVAGKYVPQLKFLDVLLGEEEALPPGVVYYQRLLSRDQDEAEDLVEDYLREHSAEELFQDVLLPALVQARSDLARGDLDEDRAGAVYKTTREVLEELESAAAEPPVGNSAGDSAPKASVVGAPAHDEADELALVMLRQLLRTQGYRVEVIPHKSLAGEVLELVTRSNPAVVCVASLPPGGLAPARYLCKRIKAQCPEVKLVVGRWGQKEKAEGVRERLKAGGADQVGFTLAETRAQVVPLLQFASTTEAGTRPGAKGGPELAASR